MISEAVFSRSYSSFWQDFFPWINPYCSKINKILEYNNPIEITENSAHRAINNSIAFFHFRNLYNNHESILLNSKEEAISYLKKFPRNNIDTYDFSELDQNIINFQIKNLLLRYNTNIIISPFFQGCGILDNCYGDLITGTTLVEIKAGSRDILPSDIKQLLIYIALNWSSLTYKHNINHIEIYNPRLGYSWSESVDNLILSIADMPKEYIFDQFSKFLASQSDNLDI